MRCEICQNKEATVHVTDSVNSQKQTAHLCEDCSHQYTDIMVNLVKQISDSLASVSSKVLKEKICPHCGVSLSKIVKTGRFGCPKDYVVFKKEIEPILNRLHSTTKHVGKVPAAIVKKKIKSLERLINKAIENEKYEEAARYRDEIKRLQS